MLGGVLRFAVTVAAVPLCAQYMQGVHTTDWTKAAMIGVVLAVAGVMMYFSQRLQMRSVVVAGVCAAVLLALGGATLLRAHSWSSNVLLAKAGTEAAPTSPRAWIELCDALFIAGGGVNVRSNPNLEDAIAACAAGASPRQN